MAKQLSAKIEPTAPSCWLAFATCHGYGRMRMSRMRLGRFAKTLPRDE